MDTSSEFILELRLFISCLALGIDKPEKLDSELVKNVSEQLKFAAHPLLKQVNQLLMLDDDLLPQSLQMRFADFPIFARVISRTHGTLQDTTNTLVFLNACGRALLCFARQEDKDAEETLEMLLTQTVQNPIHPLVTSYPWLIQNPEFTNLQNWKDPIQCARRKLGDADPTQVNLLQIQLQSINFDKNTYLPSYQELNEAFDAIASNNNTAKETRKKIVSEWIQNGCAITYQDAPFRLLTEDEQKYALHFLDQHLKPNFKDQNLPLAKELIEKYLVVESSIDALQSVKEWLTLLVRMDNKLYFNDLGQVLGSLLKKAKSASQPYYYSMPQLGQWLLCLSNEQSRDQRHYPIDLLNEVLTASLAKTNGFSTLLNKDLLKLTRRTTLDHSVKIIKNIAKSSLPYQCRLNLVKLTTGAGKDLTIVQYGLSMLTKLNNNDDNKASVQWLTKLSELMIVLQNSQSNKFEAILDCVGKARPQSTELREPIIGLDGLWKKRQSKLISLRLQGYITDDGILWHFNSSSNLSHALYSIIAMPILENESKDKDYSDLSILRQQLLEWSERELIKLANYCQSAPIPSFAELLSLTKSEKIADNLIHHFETVTQATRPYPKRHYSLTDEDNRSLQRVLSGIKRKGQGFIPEEEQARLLALLSRLNHFSQYASLDTMKMAALQEQLQSALSRVKNAKSSSSEQHHASADLLACMREILLRKTGKWANHTQMLDLLYAALYNDDSLMHQVRTGEGKSIIAAMRTSYLALMGNTVDLFTAKESLSKRDYEDFSPVYQAMGIPCAYITARSPADAYKTHYGSIRGAINILTVGQFSLFHSAHIWEGKTLINLDRKKRVAFLDEGDQILKDETTQFNYVDSLRASADERSLYNFDEWVYRATYEFYLEYQASFVDEKTGNWNISRNKHLQLLCERLQKKQKFAPKQSLFFDKYIIPALSNEKRDLDERDEILVYLLTAAHTAHGMQEDREYCIQPEMKPLSVTEALSTRANKVMIGNQVMCASTYSNLVTQFSHVIGNLKAVEKEKTAPDFFIEPGSTIALSQNVNYLLKKHYYKIEACTATAGNAKDLASYEEYGIKHTVKLPTHQPIRTEFKESLYSPSEQAQLAALVKAIQENRHRPILITCRDDIAVKRLSKQLRALLQESDPNIDLSKFYTDTNDAGIPESVMVPLAGDVGAVTLSSRMGRGTDIKPKTEEGLMLFRTDPAISRVVKQESGRQGRNGEIGCVQEIINYARVQAQYEYYERFHDEHLDTVFNEQRAHLNDKLNKHARNGLKKLDWLKNDPLKQEQYLKSRTVPQLEYEIKHKKEQYLRRKENLIAILTGHVQDALREIGCNHVNNLHRIQLQTAWLKCHKQIEKAWGARLAGKQQDNGEVYLAFFKIADMHWQELCSHLTKAKSDVSLNASSVKNLSNFTEQELEDKIFVTGFIETTIDLWTKKLNSQSAPLTINDMEALQTLRRGKLRKVQRKYHTDKSHDNNDDVIKKANDLQEVLNNCINKIKSLPNYIPPAAEEVQAPLLFAKEPKKGAMVIYKGAPQREISIQQVDMPQVISFYQAFQKGAQNHHFSKRQADTLDAVYGNKQQHFDYFYQTLATATVYNPQHPLDKHAQAQRRHQLFSKLTTFTQYPAFYSIPCNIWAQIIAHLLNQKNNQYNARYLTCLEHFLQQGLLSKSLPNGWNSQDIPKIGQLLLLSMHIVTKRYIKTASSTLLTMNDYIFNNLWSSFDEQLIHHIQQIFAEIPGVTRLLMSRTNANDLSYFLQLLAKNVKYNTGVVHLNQLKAYLKNNWKALLETPEAIKPLFQLTLGGKDNDATNYLPPPNCLPALPNELNGHFWYFLTQRCFIGEGACEKLLNTLSNQQGHPDFINKVINPLTSLPPYITLDCINEHLQFKLGAYSWNDTEKSLLQLKTAGDVFNRFIKEKLVNSNDTLIDIKIKPSEAEQSYWYNFFNAFPAKSATLFTKVLEKYPLIPLSKLETISAVFAENSIKNNNTLEAALILANKLEALPEKKQKIIWNAFCRSYEEKDIPKFTAFTDMIIATPELTEADINMIWLAQTRRNPDIDRLKTFIEKIKNSGLSANTLSPWCDAYFHGHLNNNQLNEALNVLKKAQALQENGQYLDFFGGLTCKESKYRPKIMQYLHYGILNLADGANGANFQELYLQEYKSLAEKLPVLPPPPKFYKLSFMQRHRVLRETYRNVMRFSQELVEISKPPFQNQAAVLVEHDWHAHQHKNYFKEQQHRYDTGFWKWRSGDRKRLAQDLFSKLIDKPAFTQTKARYYSYMLKTISDKQKELLQTDTLAEDNLFGIKRNKKGYSRLYDIMSHMFMQVARDCLTDRVASFDVKSPIQALFQEQLIFQVTMLCDRLEKTEKDDAVDLAREIKNVLHQDIPRALSLNQAISAPLDLKEKLVSAIKKGAIPKHLIYLVNNVDCLLTFYRPTQGASLRPTTSATCLLST